jgi:branched-chain amino acid transport system II carrier protein
VLASVIFAGIIISAVSEKGYHSPEKRSHITLLSGGISTICLLLIYGGLIYLGATSGYLTDNEVSRTDLLLYISHAVLGKWGTTAVALAIGFACLTTAIALTSSVGSFFEDFTKGRLPYKVGVVFCTIVSIVLSINKVDSIIQYAAYILLFLYPIVFTIILDVLLFGNTIKSRTPYLVSIAVTAVLSFIDSCKTWGVSSLEQVYALKAYLPLDSYSLGWLLPSLLAFLGAAVRRGNR